MSSRWGGALYFTNAELGLIAFMLVLLAGAIGTATGVVLGATIKSAWMFAAAVFTSVDPMPARVVEPMLWGSVTACALLSMRASLIGLSDC